MWNWLQILKDLNYCWSSWSHRVSTCISSAQHSSLFSTKYFYGMICVHVDSVQLNTVCWCYISFLICRYEDGVTTLWKVALVSDFIWSEAPLEFLGTVGQLSFADPACLSIKNHELTTEEVNLFLVIQATLY